MLQGIRPSQRLNNTLALPRQPSPASKMVNNNANIAVPPEENAPSHKGVNKWKNKLKNIFNGPQSPGHAANASGTANNNTNNRSIVSGTGTGTGTGSGKTAPRSVSLTKDGKKDKQASTPTAESTQEKDDSHADISVGGSTIQDKDLPASDSYEARLSRLVGDLEDVDYGANQTIHNDDEGDSSFISKFTFPASGPGEGNNSNGDINIDVEAIGLDSIQHAYSTYTATSVGTPGASVSEEQQQSDFFKGLANDTFLNSTSFAPSPNTLESFSHPYSSFNDATQSDTLGDNLLQQRRRSALSGTSPATSTSTFTASPLANGANVVSSISLSAIESSSGTDMSTPTSSQGNLPAQGDSQHFVLPISSTNANGQTLFQGENGTMTFSSPSEGSDNGPTYSNTLDYASLTASTPFSFDDYDKFIDGGSLNFANAKPDTTHNLIMKNGERNHSNSSNSSGNSGGSEFSNINGIATKNNTQNDSGLLDFTNFDLGLFPLPKSVPSPTSDASSGPSPALSYGESSTSNTSFEEANQQLNNLLNNKFAVNHGVGQNHLKAPGHDIFPDGSSKNSAVAGVPTPPFKTPTQSPRHSVSSTGASVPTTPQSMRQLPHSVSSSHLNSTHSNHMASPPFRRFQPVVHASALAWRVAPMSMSPQSAIVVDAKPRQMGHMNQPSFTDTDPYPTSPTRLTRLSTTSSPELKRRRNGDDDEETSESIEARIHNANNPGGGQVNQTMHPQTSTPNRPIAGRRRVASRIQPSPSMTGLNQSNPNNFQAHHSIHRSKSHSHIQSSSLNQASSYFMPVSTLQQPQQSWLSDDIISNLYTVHDPQNFSCMIQGCSRLFNSEDSVRSHVQTHFAPSGPSQAPAPQHTLSHSASMQHLPRQHQHQHQQYGMQHIPVHNMMPQANWV